jgi:hypothetical protein
MAFKLRSPAFASGGEIPHQAPNPTKSFPQREQISATRSA